MNKQFSFKEELKEKQINVVSTTMKEIKNAKCKAQQDYKKTGLYVLYHKNKLMKIGKATDKNGIYHRMVQYYNLNKNGGCPSITEENRDEINVDIAFIDDKDKCWYMERKMQVLAWECGEKMPWENKTRN